MIKVDNKKTIHHVADLSFWADKMRNIFAIAAIVLTTILFSGLFTIANSVITSTQESTMRQVGGSAHGGFKRLTKEQYLAIKEHPSIKEISYTVVLGIGENPELAKRNTELRYANDELAADLMFSLPTTGRLPQEPDEIATDTIVLQYLGVSPELGSDVTITYSLGGEQITDTFKLVGFWEGDVLMPASQVWLDRDYVEQKLADADLSAGAYSDFIGKISADIMFSNSLFLEKKMEKVVEDCGYEISEMNAGVNWAYVGGAETIDPGTVLGLIGILAVIIFCGYLMISNVFLISVAKDVRFYGLLKTIGTTGKQLKKLIKRQVLWLCLIGIPIGCLLGCLIGVIITPIILGSLNTNVIKTSVSIWIFVFSAAFAVLTVSISVRKAAKLASKVSPIEALRTQENVERRHKKKVFVIISLSLSLIVLNMAYTMADSFDMEKYIKNRISHDFVMGDVSWFNSYGRYDKQDTVSDSFMEKMASFEGVEAAQPVYFTEQRMELDERWNDHAKLIEEKGDESSIWIDAISDEINQGWGTIHEYGIEDGMWEELKLFEGNIDIEKLHTGKYAVVEPQVDSGEICYYHVGDLIETIAADGTKTTREVLAVASLPYSLTVQHGHPTELDVYVPTDVFLSEIEQKAPMIFTLDMEDGHMDEVEAFLSDYCENVDSNMQYASRATYEKEYANSTKMYRLVGIVVGALLALIGIANFANMIITSIMTRRRELAMLSGIGMTRKQQSAMLMKEGLSYTLWTLVFSFTVGVLLGRQLLIAFLGTDGYFTVRFTIVPSLICIPGLILVSMILPAVCQKIVNKKSIVERIRQD